MERFCARWSNLSSYYWYLSSVSLLIFLVSLWYISLSAFLSFIVFVRGLVKLIEEVLAYLSRSPPKHMVLSLQLEIHSCWQSPVVWWVRWCRGWWASGKSIDVGYRGCMLKRQRPSALSKGGQSFYFLHQFSYFVSYLLLIHLCPCHSLGAVLRPSSQWLNFDCRFLQTIIARTAGRLKEPRCHIRCPLLAPE